MADDKLDSIVVFMDTVGRTILGEKILETNTELQIKNPAVVNVSSHQEGGQVRMALQLFPLFFREFQGDKSEEITWTYNKANITMPVKQPVLEAKLGIQYKQLFINQPMQPAPIAQQIPQQQKQEVIKLFDD